MARHKFLIVANRMKHDKTGSKVGDEQLSIILPHGGTKVGQVLLKLLPRPRGNTQVKAALL